MNRPPKTGILGTLTGILLTYETVKTVKVQNTFIAIVNRLLQLLIFGYIAFYIVWYKKGYQEFQEPRGTSIIKVKGIAKLVANDASRFFAENSSHLWDIAEYQLPPLEDNAFFLATRKVITYNQTEGICPTALESAVDDKLFCDNATASVVCPQDHPTPNTFGYFTGNCVPSKENASRTVCEIQAWCPEELEDSVEYTMNTDDVDNFTVYVKTMVSFGSFNINVRNVRSDTNFSCRYDPTNDPYCPIFRIGDIFPELKTNKESLIQQGGLIEIRQDWTCNFDFSKDKCYPTFEFNLLQSGEERPSPGVNYRYADKIRKDDIDYRTLTKVYGLRFVVAFSGKGGQFNIVNLFVAIGSGIGFMVIAGVVCDVIFMYIHKSREEYRRRKFTVWEVGNDQAGTEHLVKDEMALKPSNNLSTVSDVYSEVL